MSTRSAYAAFSPYLDVTLGSFADFPAAARRARLRAVTLAFVNSVRGTCRATWQGKAPLAQIVAPATVARLRAAGTAAAVSFGGRDGPELAQVCRTSRGVVAQYQAVVDAYRLTRVDFDLEGPALADLAVDQRRWQAIALLQAAAQRRHRRLFVSVSLPVSTTGFSPEVLGTLRRARIDGVRPDAINLLAMDYGPEFPSSTRRSMSSYAEATASSVVAQLGGLYPGVSSSGRWSRISITPMVGSNDVFTETFTLTDARRLVSFAREKGAGALSMWSLGRDQACPRGTPPRAQPTCSGLSQPPLAFARTFSGFAR